MELRSDNKPKIVIAGSGMLTGGRMLNYLEKQAQNQNNTLLFVGFQSEGTRGRKLLDGEKELKVYGKVVPFNMQVENIDGLSAHADHTELMDWMSEIKEKPERIFIVHGEKESAEAVQKGIQESYGWEAEIPQLYNIVEID
jgi:metallo-beta-lactamase family protein